MLNKASYNLLVLIMQAALNLPGKETLVGEILVAHHAQPAVKRIARIISGVITSRRVGSSPFGIGAAQPTNAEGCDPSFLTAYFLLATKYPNRQEKGQH